MRAAGIGAEEDFPVGVAGIDLGDARFGFRRVEAGIRLGRLDNLAAADLDPHPDLVALRIGLGGPFEGDRGGHIADRHRRAVGAVGELGCREIRLVFVVQLRQRQPRRCRQSGEHDRSQHYPARDEHEHLSPMIGGTIQALSPQGNSELAAKRGAL